MTRTTGWIGEGPDGSPAMPVTEMLLARREHRAGALETALARSAAADVREARDAAAGARDPDEFAAALINRGYTPGLISQLALRLGDVTAELEAERSKIEKGERTGRRVRAMHERGQIGAMDAQRMMDGDFGDEATVTRLERQADGLRRQIAEASEAMAPQHQRAPDPLEAASRNAQELLAEVTRQQRTAAAPARRPERRPFAGGEVRRSELECVFCVQNDVSHEDSTLLHLDPRYNVPITTQAEAEAEQAEHAGRSDQGGQRPMIYR